MTSENLPLEQALKCGIDAHRSGRLQEADRYYTAILKTHPRQPEVNHNMGVLLAQLGNLNKSLTFFKAATDANPNLLQYWISYLQTLIKLNKLDYAQSVLDQARRYEKSPEDFIKIVNIIRSKKEEIHPPGPELDTIIKLYKSALFEQALKAGQELANRFPDSAVLHNINGATTLALSQYKNAIKNFSSALLINPNYAQAHFNMAIALQEIGDLNNALKSYQSAINLNPNYYEAYYNVGLLFQREGDFKKSLEAYLKVIEINPKDAEAHNNIGNVLTRQKKLTEAVTSYRNAINLNKSFAEAYYNLGNVFVKLERQAEAIDLYNVAIALKADYLDAKIAIADAMLSAGDVTGAIEGYTNFLLHSPNYVHAYKNILTIHCQLDPGLTTRLVSLMSPGENINLKVKKDPANLVLLAIKAYLSEDYEMLRSYNISYAEININLVTHIPEETKKFCETYHIYLKKLSDDKLQNQKKPQSDRRIYHIGESHSLSYAHQWLKLNNQLYKIQPMITFGAKAFHFSKIKNNKWKAITESNLCSIPKGSRILVSFGEIDCRPNEGIIYAAKKLKQPKHKLIKDTVESYLAWFKLKNSGLNHSMYFLNIPAPLINAKLSLADNNEVAETIRLFNAEINQQTKLFDFNLLDVYNLSLGENGFSNRLFHIDGVHLGPAALPEIQKQLSEFEPN